MNGRNVRYWHKADISCLASHPFQSVTSGRYDALS